MKISATVSYLREVEIECDDKTSHDRIKDLIMQEADKQSHFNDCIVTSCLKLNEQCSEESEELTEVLG